MEKDGSNRPRIILIDGSGFVYRAFYALPRLTTREGMPTGAVFGFLQMIHKVMNDFDYDALVVAFDTKAPTFRHELYEDYKKSRPPMPPELTIQMPYIRDLCDALGIPVVEKEGYEADDLIAVLARKAVQKGYDVLIVTQDKDMLQLLESGVRVYHPLRDRLYDREVFVEEYGFEPRLIRDYLALVGDKVDEIPGVKGIGDKTAGELIRKYGDLEAIYQHLDEIPQRFRKKLLEGKASAFLSRDLIDLATDVDLELDPESFHRRPPDHKRLQALLKELEFYRFLNEYLMDIHSSQASYRLIEKITDWEQLVNEVKQAGQVSVSVVYDGDHPVFARPVGLGFSIRTSNAWVARLHLQRRLDQPGWVLFDIRPFLEAIFHDPGVTVWVYDAKTTFEVLGNLGIELPASLHDTMLMAYVLDPGRPIEFQRLVADRLLYRVIDPDTVCSSGKSWQNVEIASLVDYLGERADLNLQLGSVLQDEIRQPERMTLWSVYQDMDKPLVPVLMAMEKKGIRVDVRRLKELAGQISRQVAEIQEKIFDIVGFTFNLNSSKQLAKVLFEHLGLKPGGRTRKTRQYSTRMDVLEELAREHEVPRLILQYRTLAKTKSTFVDALIRSAHKETHRVHARFHQTVTATGRLSSSDPNLQNIPVRDELGDALRDSFIADEGNLLISADYSQIELRILAHLSEDPGLIEAFQRGEDIHARTASRVLDKPMDAVDENDRRLAKAVNYGIAYGLSAYGLSQQTGMDVHEAQTFIDRYFTMFAGVRRWLEQTLAQARETGYVETLFGRRRYLPDIHSKDHKVRQTAERQAVNMPVQGTAADLMKKAMIRIHQRLVEEYPDAALLLQVHDELVFECPEQNVAVFIPLIRQEMEHVHPMKVPLVVDIHAGPSWYRAKKGV